MACSEKGVASILIGDDPNARWRRIYRIVLRDARLVAGDRDYEKLVAQVIGFVLPLDVRGTTFQQRVGQALREIPMGQMVSCAEIAAKIGSPKAVRAVAGACAASNIVVGIPCHLVLHNDWALSGYAWGFERAHRLRSRSGLMARWFLHSERKIDIS